MLHDSAIDRWGAMRENTLKHFRWNKRTVTASLVWGLVVPLAMYEVTVAEMVR